MSVASAETREHRPGSTPAGGAGRLPPLWLNRGALIDGKYEVVRVIGQGGMGRVVEVVCRADGGRLALKLAHDRGLARRRLIREARILAGLRHPHLLPVLDASLEPDPPYFVMPLAEESLDSELARGGGDLTWALATFRQVCLGVQALHRAGVVHRDLKPANILRMSDGTYRVADLGAAKREPRDSTILTRTCAVVGTLQYLAPEQLLPSGSRLADARTDVYQLGKILYQVVSGRSPALIEPEGLPRGLGRIVRRATALRPDDRYPDVAALLEAVEVAALAAADAPPPAPASLAQVLAELDRLIVAGRAGNLDGDEVLDVLAASELLPDDEALEVFDRLPTALLAVLGRRFGARFASRLAAYIRGLERGCGRRDFHYADRVTRRMKAILAASPAPEVVARAVEAVLIVAVVLNRYSAMAELRRILYQVRGGEQALALAERLRERREYFQEIAPYLERERLHAALRAVVDDLRWIHTVAF